MKQAKKLYTHPDEAIILNIHLIRGQKVLIDSDLAKLYGVETKVLNQAVKRNIDRFPSDFMFQLTQEELDSFNIEKNSEYSESGPTRSQFVTSSGSILTGELEHFGNKGYGGRKYSSYAFT